MAPAAARGPESEPEELRAVAIIPARLGSRRLPRKMLLARTGRPLFEHTARNVERCPQIERVVVATDSDEIVAAARERGLAVLMTRADHPSGTDRVHEACRALEREGERFDVVLDVQGDEPEVAPEDLGALVRVFREPEVRIATLCGPIRSEDEALDASIVKVVRDERGDALYFSRACIPCRAHPREGVHPGLDVLRRHVGVYAFRPEALASFCALPVAPLESAENLEQLRWLAAGNRMRVLEASHVPLGIDTEKDYEAFVARVAQRPSPHGART